MGQGNSETTPLKVLPVSTDTVLVVCQDEQQMEPHDIDVGAVPSINGAGVRSIVSTKRPTLGAEQPGAGANYTPAAWPCPPKAAKKRYPLELVRCN